MKMKILFTFLICVSSGIWAIAQSLSPEIISTDGNVSNTSTISIEWTIGELMVSSIHRDKTMITEGFHQPLIEVIEVPDFFNLTPRKGNTSFEKVMVKVWPNPLDVILNIQVEAAYDQKLFVQCFDAMGKRVTIKKEIFPNEISKLSLDGYPSGLYFLRVSDVDQKLLKTMIINKL